MNDGSAWAVMGLSEFKLKDYDNALITWSVARARLWAEPLRLARYHLGILLNRSGKFASAARLLTRGEFRVARQRNSGHRPVTHSAPAEQVPPQKHARCRAPANVLLQGSKYDQAFPKLQQLMKESQCHFSTTPTDSGWPSLSQYDEGEPQLREEARDLRRVNSHTSFSPRSNCVRTTPADASSQPSARSNWRSNRRRLTHPGSRVPRVGKRERSALRKNLETANKINPGSRKCTLI